MTNAERQFGRSDFTKLFAVSAVFLAAAGCATHDARKHLEGVAKGWCETIRASQIIPVYPLTQDLTVGDVFLVQTLIFKQSDDQEIVDGTPAAEVLAKATNLCDNNTGAFLLPGWRKALPADC